MELASSCCEMMSGGGGEVLTRIVGAFESSRTREPVVLCGPSNEKAVRIPKALRIERRQEQQTFRRLRVTASALVSGKEDVRSDGGAEPPLRIEPSSLQPHDEELDAAGLVQELQEVYASGRTRSAEWREEQLKGMMRMMLEQEGEITEALRQDIGKPKFEAYVSEINGVYAAADEAAQNVRIWMQREKVPTTMTTYPSTAEIIPEPLGVALIISAWNYPLLLALVPVIGAIAGGNVVVLKPSELAPAISALLAKLFPLYLDRLAIRVQEGGIPETTALLEQPWDKILFTGSSRVGRIVLAAAAKHLTPVTLELGGKCPVIVDSTVDMEVVGRRLAWGKWAGNNGQACIAPDYLLVEEPIVPDLIKTLTDNVKKFYGEDPSESEDIARIVNLFHFNRLSGLLEDKKTAEAIIFGGDRLESKLYISPTIVLDPPLDSPIMQEEIFGPILPIIQVKDVSEAIRFVNSRPKPLAIYAFTSDKAVQERVLQETSSGGVTLNDSILHAATPGLALGGVGESGYGAYRGKFSFDTFSHKKPVLNREVWLDSEFRCPPYSEQKFQILKAVLMKDFLGMLRAILGFKK